MYFYFPIVELCIVNTSRFFFFFYIDIYIFGINVFNVLLKFFMGIL